MDDRLLEPVEFYNSFLKDKFLKSCEDYFEKLVKDNKVDVEANKQTCNKLYKEQENIENTQKDIQSKKSLKGFLIFVCIASILAAIIGLFSIFGGNFIETTPSILMAVFGILLFVGMLLLIIKVVNPKIKNFEQLLKEAQARAQKYLNEAKEAAEYLLSTNEKGAYYSRVIERPGEGLDAIKGFCVGIYTGPAGEGFFLDALYEYVKDNRYIDFIRDVADDLINNAIETDTGIKWTEETDVSSDGGFVL